MLHSWMVRLYGETYLETVANVSGRERLIWKGREEVGWTGEIFCRSFGKGREEIITIKKLSLSNEIYYYYF